MTTTAMMMAKSLYSLATRETSRGHQDDVNQRALDLVQQDGPGGGWLFRRQAVLSILASPGENLCLRQTFISCSLQCVVCCVA